MSAKEKTMFNKLVCLFIFSVSLNLVQVCFAERKSTIIRMGNNTVLDGFTITGASDACISGEDVDFSIENCTVLDSDNAGIRAIDGDVSVQWCDIKQNRWYAVYHAGEGFTLRLENCQIRKNQRLGLFCQDSTLICTNSIVSEADLTETGNAGITLFNASSPPLIQNVTCAHNKSVGIWKIGGALPQLQNCIVYHNGGPSLVGFSADDAAWYSCIQDCNSVNENIDTDPEFAYYDPNNMRLSLASPCLDSGNPYLDYQNQLEMDKKDRVYGTAVDRGAYELTCEDVSNTFDWNADGVVNLHEFGRFAAVWRAHDPNDPAILDPQHPDHEYLTDPNSPGYVSEEAMALWHPGYAYNFAATGSSQYAIDVADLAAFVEQAPWLWMACWLTEGEPMQQMMVMGEGMLLGGFEVQTAEPSALEQLGDLVSIVGQLEAIWLDDPNIQQEIDATQWQGFMDALYDNLLEVYLSTQ